jgi:hypothetical protein
MKCATAILITLLACLPCFAGTYYVATDGTDSGDCTVAACATVQYAFGQIPNSDSHTIELAAGDYQEDIEFGSSNGLTLTIQGATGTASDVTITNVTQNETLTMSTLVAATVQDITFINTNGSEVQCVQTIGPVGGGVTYDNCVFTKVGSTSRALQNSSGGGDFTITNCTFNAAQQAFWSSGNIGDLTVTNCTFNDMDESSGGVVLQGGTLDTCVIDSCVFAGSSVSSWVFQYNNSSYLDSFQLIDCTGTIGAVINEESYMRHVDIERNTLTLLAVNNALRFGVETVDDADLELNANPILGGLIAGNSFTYTSATATHILQLMVGADNFYVSGNSFVAPNTTTAYGVVVKGRGSCFYNNGIYHGGDSAMYLSGARSTKVVGCTIVSGAATALRIDSNQDGIDATSNGLFDSVIMSSGSDTAFEYDVAGDSGADDWSWSAQNNAYYTAGANLANIGGTSCADIAAVRARWIAYAAAGDPSYWADQTSMEGNPLIVNASNGQFSSSEPTFATASTIGARLGKTLGDARSVTGNHGSHYIPSAR